MQAYPLEHVLGHTQHGVDRLDLLIAHEGQPRHSKQCVEGVHLRKRGLGLGVGLGLKRLRCVSQAALLVLEL